MKFKGKNHKLQVVAHFLFDEERLPVENGNVPEGERNSQALYFFLIKSCVNNKKGNNVQLPTKPVLSPDFICTKLFFQEICCRI